MVPTSGLALLSLSYVPHYYQMYHGDLFCASSPALNDWVDYEMAMNVELLIRKNIELLIVICIFHRFYMPYKSIRIPMVPCTIIKCSMEFYFTPAN